MRFLLVILFISISLKSISQTEKVAKILIDSSKIAFLPINDEIRQKFKIIKETKLKEEEFYISQKLLNEKVDEYNFNEKLSPTIHSGFDFIDLSNYHQQYLVFINFKNEKEVFINCFCEQPSSNWGEVLTEVDDGGNCFFSLRINITNKKAYNLDVNGP